MDVFKLSYSGIGFRKDDLPFNPIFYLWRSGSQSWAWSLVKGFTPPWWTGENHGSWFKKKLSGNGPNWDLRHTTIKKCLEQINWRKIRTGYPMIWLMNSFYDLIFALDYLFLSKITIFLIMSIQVVLFVFINIKVASFDSTTLLIP